jgi:hypothetical protein
MLGRKKGFSSLSTSEGIDGQPHDIEMQPPVSHSPDISDAVQSSVAMEDVPSDEDDSEHRPMLSGNQGINNSCSKFCFGCPRAILTACTNGFKRALGLKRDPTFQARSIPFTGGITLRKYLASRGRDVDPALLQSLSIPNIVRNQKYRASTFIFQVAALKSIRNLNPSRVSPALRAIWLALESSMLIAVL